MSSKNVPSDWNLLVRTMANQHIILDMLSELLSNENKTKNEIYEAAMQDAREEELLLLKTFLSETES